MNHSVHLQTTISQKTRKQRVQGPSKNLLIYSIIKWSKKQFTIFKIQPSSFLIVLEKQNTFKCSKYSSIYLQTKSLHNRHLKPKEIEYMDSGLSKKANKVYYKGIEAKALL